MSTVTRPSGASARDAERAFATALERAQAGSPVLLLLWGEAAAVRATLATLPGESTLPANTRVIEVHAPQTGRYDPVAALAESWKRGARRLAFDSSTRGLAWNWLGLVPFWGNLVAAVYETIAALRRGRRTTDPALGRLLRAARKHTTMAVIFDLDRADRPGAARLVAALDRAPAGARLLILAGIPGRHRIEPPLVEMARSLPPDRVMIHRIGAAGGVHQLDKLPPAAAEAVRAAARLGEEFDGASAARSLGIDELAAEDRLAIAAHAGLVKIVGTRDTNDGDIVTVYRFASPDLHQRIIDAEHER